MLSKAANRTFPTQLETKTQLSQPCFIDWRPSFLGKEVMGFKGDDDMFL